MSPVTRKGPVSIFTALGEAEREDADRVSCILIAEQHREGRRSVSAALN